MSGERSSEGVSGGPASVPEGDVETLVERSFGLVQDLSAPPFADLAPGARVELWSFAPPAARRAAEAALAARGVEARVHAAWKTALHAMLEATAPPVEIVYPVLPGQDPERFLRELHPAAELWPGLRLTPVPSAAPVCRLRHADGREEALAIPVRPRRAPHGGEVLSACGWLRATPPGAEVPEVDAPWADPIEQALQAAFAAVSQAIEGRGWRSRGPHFDRLVLRIEAPLVDRPLAWGAESLSLAEALHEELYFGALDLLRAAAGLPPGDRSLIPGEVVPEIAPVPAGAPVRLRVTVSAPPEAPAPARPAPEAVPAPDLATLDRPMTAREIAAALAALGGEPLEVRSRRGRAVQGRVLAGQGPGVVITGGQHANEPTGIPGALLAARTLAAEGVPVAVCPLENPDGHALHMRLRETAPRHMHHAARYTALGADLAFVPGGEGALRPLLRAAADRGAGADLHLSLHGYPSHEWLHPFTGYLPHGFESWSLPRGCFLILRFDPAWRGPAQAVLHAAAAALEGDAEIAALNARQLETLARYAPSAAPERIGCVPVVQGPPSPSPHGPPFPVTLIVETPDETVDGPLFRLLLRAQALAAVAAARAFREAVIG
ncbi:peptidase M14 [Albimonas sp. CAU 1670]|uniref:peptidase M14 n=1 Tax=Albimonas sp. CAU 1670 TaxID=3032599 RepID=UPI0023DB9B55|nr:peptidase M14 [Albimonas sp. CAU 1670]MDF2232528.1 peptidase M14 [Albimonas sp. CAU 1670]